MENCGSVQLERGGWRWPRSRGDKLDLEVKSEVPSSSGKGLLPDIKPGIAKVCPCSAHRKYLNRTHISLVLERRQAFYSPQRKVCAQECRDIALKSGKWMCHEAGRPRPPKRQCGRIGKPTSNTASVSVYFAFTARISGGVIVPTFFACEDPPRD